jgi:hypothetical protein
MDCSHRARGLRQGRSLVRTSWAPLLVSFVSLVAACGPQQGSVEVTNDLDVSVALVRCESSSISGADPVFISPNQSKTIHPANACLVYGPTTKFGPFGGMQGEGPYMGCLPMPTEGQRPAKTLVSRVEKRTGFTACDESRR